MSELQKMKEALQSNPELQEKFEEAKKAAVENGMKSDIEVLVNAAKAMGYEISMTELEKEYAEAQELSEDDLICATGGIEDNGEDEYGHDNWCFTAWHCRAITLHTETDTKEASCWAEYSCHLVYRCLTW